eukprot:COSAG01_NODE_53027_length_342_cov_0.748971_1_plen_73_part_01
MHACIFCFPDSRVHAYDVCFNTPQAMLQLAAAPPYQQFRQAAVKKQRDRRTESPRLSSQPRLAALATPGVGAL